VLAHCKGNEASSTRSVAWEFNVPSLHVRCKCHLLRDRTGRKRIRGRQRSQVEVRSSAFSAISAVLNLTSKPCPDSGGSAVCSYAEHRLSASLSSHGLAINPSRISRYFLPSRLISSRAAVSRKAGVVDGRVRRNTARRWTKEWSRTFKALAILGPDIISISPSQHDEDIPSYGPVGKSIAASTAPGATEVGPIPRTAAI
jgi:hypothetical protein